ncbi:MAG: hypothetical protein IH596_07455 [Bacteroidales bacterium]|nr:hypothetical protein [Bacteroidales bacterium]
MKQSFHIVFAKPEISQMLIGGIELIFPYTCMSSLHEKDSRKIINLEIWKYKQFVRVSDKILCQIELPQGSWFEKQAQCDLCKILFPLVKRHIRDCLTKRTLEDGDVLVIHPNEISQIKSDSTNLHELPAGAAMRVIRPVPSLTT